MLTHRLGGVGFDDLVQVMTLELRLSAMGFDCWLDQNAAKITKESMKLGVASSRVFLIFLSEGVLTRPFCLFEIETALEMKKPVTLMHETDGRHGKAVRTAPKLGSSVLRLPVAGMVADTPLRFAAGAFDFGSQEVRGAPKAISSIFLTHESLRESLCPRTFALAAALSSL